MDYQRQFGRRGETEEEGRRGARGRDSESGRGEFDRGEGYRGSQYGSEENRWSRESGSGSLYGQGRGSQGSWRPGGGSERDSGEGGGYGSGSGYGTYGSRTSESSGYGEGYRRYGENYGRGPEGNDASSWRSQRSESGSGSQREGGSGYGSQAGGEWDESWYYSQGGGSGSQGGDSGSQYGQSGYGARRAGFGSQRGQSGSFGSQSQSQWGGGEGADRSRQSWGGSYGFGYGGGRGAQSRGRFAGKGPKGYQRSDDRIKEEISDRLEENGDVDASEITVMVASGEATLEGTVPDRWMKRMAEDLVEDCSGVKQVHNRLRIKGNEESGERGGVGVKGLDTDTAGSALASSAPGTGSESGGLGGATGTGSAGSRSSEKGTGRSPKS